MCNQNKKYSVNFYEEIGRVYVGQLKGCNRLEQVTCYSLYGDHLELGKRRTYFINLQMIESQSILYSI